jgi:hypothetical protein
VIAGVAPYGAEGLEWMAGMGADNVIEFEAALQGEERLRPYLAEEREALKETTAANIVASLDTLLPDVDKAVLTDEFRRTWPQLPRALRTGVDGWLDDLAFTELALRPQRNLGPDHDLAGSADLGPFAHGEWLASPAGRLSPSRWGKYLSLGAHSTGCSTNSSAARGDRL